MKQLKLWVGLIISAVCIWLALQGIDFGKVGDSLGNLNWWLIAVSYIPYFVIMVLKVTRWQILLYPDKVRFHPLYSALCISYLWSTILPARLGEVVRGYVVSAREKIGVVRVLSTILLEKILDVAINFIFLLALLPFLEIDPTFKTGVFVLGTIVIVAVAIALLMAAQRRRAEIFIRFFLKPLPAKFGLKLFEFAGQVLDSLEVLLKPRLSMNILAHTLVLWGINITLYWMIAWAINLPLTFPQAVLVMVASNLGMAVPSSPGYVGVFEAVIVGILTPFYSDKNLLLSYALMMHVTGFLPVMVLGAFYTWREGLSLGNVNKAKKDAVSDESLPAAPVVERETLLERKT